MIALLGIAAAVGGLAGPSFVTVRRVTGGRDFAPLLRGSLERTAVLAAAGLAAAVVCAQIFGGLSCVVFDYEAFEWLATPAFFIAGPPVIGLAPWAAGEILSGPSVCQEEALAAAIAAAWLAAAAGFGAALAFGVPTALTVAAAFSTVFAAVAYLRVRGGCP